MQHYLKPVEAFIYPTRRTDGRLCPVICTTGRPARVSLGPYGHMAWLWVVLSRHKSRTLLGMDVR